MDIRAFLNVIGQMEVNIVQFGLVWLGLCNCKTAPYHYGND